MQNLGFVDSKFRLAILAAKRAKQLISGSKQRVDKKAENPLTIALEEITGGKIDFDTLMMSDAELRAEILGGGPEESGEEVAQEGTETIDEETAAMNLLKKTEETESEVQSEEGEAAEEEVPEKEAE